MSINHYYKNENYKRQPGLIRLEHGISFRVLTVSECTFGGEWGKMIKADEEVQNKVRQARAAVQTQ